MKDADTRSQAEATMVAHLEWIERTTASFALRHRLDPDEAADLLGWVRLRLMEDEYAILRTFRGGTSIRTYLVAVAAHLFREYRLQVRTHEAGGRGRWRASAAAQRLGMLAVRLEALVYRDGHTFWQAAEVLRSRMQDVPDERELMRLLAQLPPRGPARPARVDLRALDRAKVCAAPADAALRQAEGDRERARLAAAIARAFQELSRDDQSILRLRFWNGLGVADIARALLLDPRAVFLRLDRLKRALRRRLERDGIDRSMVAEILSEAADYHPPAH